MLHRIIIVVNDVFILCTSNCIRCYIQLQWWWRTREKESIKAKPTINCKINGTKCTVDELITNATVVAFGFEDDSLNFYFYTLKVPLPFNSGVSRVSALNLEFFQINFTNATSLTWGPQTKYTSYVGMLFNNLKRKIEWSKLYIITKNMMGTPLKTLARKLNLSSHYSSFTKLFNLSDTNQP